jgi:hypothetical protein
LAVTSISPSHGTLGVSPDTTVVIIFTEPLVSNSVTSTTVLLVDPSAQNVPSDLSYDNARQSIKLAPDLELEDGSRYTLVLTEGVQGKTSGALPAEVTSTFQVGGAESTTNNELPVANAGPDQSAAVTDLVQLDGSASADPEGEDLIFFWQIAIAPDGANPELSGEIAVAPTFQTDLAGLYTIGLVVNDTTQNSDPDYVNLEMGTGGEDTGG